LAADLQTGSADSLAGLFAIGAPGPASGRSNAGQAAPLIRLAAFESPDGVAITDGDDSGMWRGPNRGRPERSRQQTKRAKQGCQATPSLMQPSMQLFMQLDSPEAFWTITRHHVTEFALCEKPQAGCRWLAKSIALPATDPSAVLYLTTS